MEESGRRKRRILSWTVNMCAAAAGLAMGCMLVWHYVIWSPCRMESDCRGQGIQAESLKRWEEQGRGDALEITGLAGWRREEQQTVTSVSTGRRQRSQVTAVYGEMELAMPSKILSGRCGLDVEGSYCVLSESLAGHLFGSVDVAGECVKIGDKPCIVVGVVENEEDILMIPMKEGKIEQMAVAFKSRIGAKEKMSQVMEDVGGY